MKYLFDIDGMHAIEAFCMAKVLIAFDYDGTLAPIVEDPKMAIMRTKTSDLLQEITLFAPVALISGRAKADVSGLLTTDVDFVIGNHGLEGLPGGSSTLELADKSCRSWMAKLQGLGVPGMIVEDKHYSISVHYRKCSDRAAAKLHILDIATSLVPSPRIIMGKCVVNLISPGAPHKGVALLELMLQTGCKTAIYAGDDDNDEDVFRLGEESLLTIRVGHSKDSAALFYVNSQDEMDLALCHIRTALLGSGKARRLNS